MSRIETSSCPMQDLLTMLSSGLRKLGSETAARNCAGRHGRAGSRTYEWDEANLTISDEEQWIQTALDNSASIILVAEIRARLSAS